MIVSKQPTRRARQGLMTLVLTGPPDSDDPPHPERLDIPDGLNGLVILIASRQYLDRIPEVLTALLNLRRTARDRPTIERLHSLGMLMWLDIERTGHTPPPDLGQLSAYFFNTGSRGH